MCTLSYQQFMDTVGYADLEGRVEAATALSLPIKPFPSFKSKHILEVMPAAYSKYVSKSQYPSVIDPRNVARTIALGYQVMAVFDNHNQIIYVASYKEQRPYLKLISYPIYKDHGFTEFKLIPICCKKEQAWSKLIPWHILAKMTVKWTGDFLVFVDWSFDSTSVTSKHYHILHELQACMPITSEAKL